VNRFVRRHDHLARWAKCETDNIHAGHGKLGISAIRRDSHNSSTPAQGTRHVKTPSSIEYQTLRTTEAVEKCRCVAVFIETGHSIKARNGWPGYIQGIVNPEGQMICRNRWLVFGPGLCLPDFVDAIDSAGPITDEHLAFAVERDAGGDG